MKELALWIGGLFLAVIVVILAIVLGTWMYQQFEGDIYSRDYQNKRNSQANVEPKNLEISKLIADYNKAEGERAKYEAIGDKITAKQYEGQKASTLQAIKDLADTLRQEDLSPSNSKFLASH